MTNPLPSVRPGTQPPWHMWGTTGRIDLAAGAAFVLRATQQLGRISYRRPDTWTFWLGGRIIGGTADPVNPIGVRLRINLALGIGRSVYQTEQRSPSPVINEAFAFFTWLIPAGTNPADVEFAAKYTTTVPSPPLDQTDDTTRERISAIPAQNIQVSSDVEVLKVDPNVSLNLEVTAFFAPRTHIRPDWFEGAYLGDETAGT